MGKPIDKYPTPAEMIILLFWWGMVLHGKVLLTRGWEDLEWDYMDYDDVVFREE